MKDKKDEYVYEFKLMLDGIVCKDKEFEILLDGRVSKNEKFKISETLKFRQIEDSPNPDIKFKVIGGSDQLKAITEVSGQFKSDEDYRILNENLSETERDKILKEIFEKIYHYPLILRLFRLGAVFLHDVVIIPCSDSKKEQPIPIGLNYAQLIKDRKLYTITKEEKHKLKAIMELLWNPIIDGFLPISKEPVNHIFVALEMYNNAFINIGPMEGRIRSYQSQIAFLISALEALYLEKDITESITRKLGQRVAKVLKLLGYNSFVSYNDIKKAYTIRSDYYHSNIKDWEKLKKNIKNICKNIFQIVRISILVFLELNIIKKSQKREFLTLIDNSLLDEGKATELKNKIDTLNTKSFIKKMILKI